jgi:hypothetical protein
MRGSIEESLNTAYYPKNDPFCQFDRVAVFWNGIALWTTFGMTAVKNYKI